MIALIASWLLSQKPALGEAKANAIAKGLMIAVTIGALIIGIILWVNHIQHKAVSDYKSDVQAKVVVATTEASDERLQDVQTDMKSEEVLHDVIDQAPKNTVISAPAHALACERLRRIGRIPASCRPQDGNGSEAITK